ncbi:MAG: 4-hydroxy-3-methylbut-2-enyl diphosphate reductase [Lactobacillales bacterium]|jgi:4-hydroxy-3-methylbut-2-enyl diphosphate reductase|nr:4-hydroxy-3-methylbut-2-enyl diphosphate reductase [Lactobacillales bacterium]
MEIVNITPRGYCYGVVDAMVIAKNAALDKTLPRPIYILGMIVHNQHVIESFEDIGIHTLDGENRKEILDKIDSGTVIFTAHGVSPEVIQLAKDKGLTIIDASCPDVQITHELIKNYLSEGYEIFYIGKKGHPEPEGALGIAKEHVHLISSMEDVSELTFRSDKIFVTNQTTMSHWDVSELMMMIKEKYPHARIHKEVCQATQVRQEAVAKQAHGCDLTIVIGDPKSNNTNRLEQVSVEQANVLAKRVADISEIQVDWLKGINKIAVTAGASTPTVIIREVVQFLEQFDESRPETWKIASKVSTEDILPKMSKIKDLNENRRRKMAVLRKESLTIKPSNHRVGDIKFKNL